MPEGRESEAGSPPRPITPWAWAALACSVVVCCPVATLASIILGVKALRLIGQRPELGGRRIGWLAIIIAAFVLAGQIGGAWWWHTNIRLPLINGPLQPLRAGFSGDVPGFQAAFPDPPPPESEAALFLSALSNRHGAFITLVQGPDATLSAAEGQVIVAYLARFESGSVSLRARFVPWDEQGQLVLKWAWVAIEEPDGGLLVYPASARADVPVLEPADEQPD